jgi:predicted ATP-grasp superfamily ATP-dependent carboligase
MNKLDFSKLLGEMLGAAKNKLADKWPAVEGIATTSFKTLAQTLVDIEDMTLKGTITGEQAALLLDMQKNTAKMVLLSVEIVGIVAAEEAINAALDVVRDVVNTAISFPLL